LLLPPGPWRLPIIGSLHHLLCGTPHRTLRDLSLRHGPLMLLRICKRAVLVVSSAEAEWEVFTGHGTAFEQRLSSPGIDEVSRHGMGVVFAPYDEHWRLLRRILVTELLSARRVDEFRHVCEDEAARLAASLAASSPTPRLPDRVAFLRLVRQGVDLSTLFDLRDLFPTSRLVRMLPRSRKAGQYRQDLFRLVDDVLPRHEERKPADDGYGGQDMIDVLLRIQKDGAAMRAALTPGVDVFAAALDTATSTLQWAMAELIANPRVMEKAQLEIRHALAGRERVREAPLSSMLYLKAVVKETLRLHPPIALVLRVCLEQLQ
ncbi:hypothetical protein EJB05_32869, partial [Eragrostis curvula]